MALNMSSDLENPLHFLTGMYQLYYLRPRGHIRQRVEPVIVCPQKYLCHGHQLHLQTLKLYTINIFINNNRKCLYYHMQLDSAVTDLVRYQYF